MTSPVYGAQRFYMLPGLGHLLLECSGSPATVHMFWCTVREPRQSAEQYRHAEDSAGGCCLLWS